MGRLSGKIVVVTGASAGVGRAVVRAFAARGANLGLIARGQEGLDAARREVEAQGGQALVLPLDVSDSAAVDDAADRVEETLGPIDVWVNCAMVSVFAPIVETTPQEFRRVTEVTYLGYVHGTLAALRHMRARDRGTIVQVGSALAFRSIPLQAAYCAAKHAIVGFTESLRSELMHDQSSIHVTAVHLPAINTPQFDWSRAKLPNHPQPVPPIYQPEVAADAIVFAATHRRRSLHLGWSTIKAITADKVAPGIADRYLASHAYEAQQTSEAIQPDRPDNLFSPVAGDFGARGRFDERSLSNSSQLWMTKHRGVILGVLGVGAGYALWMALRSDRARPRTAGRVVRPPRFRAPDFG